MKLTLAPILLLCINFAAAEDIPPSTSRVFPGMDGKLVYNPDEQGNIIPDFSNVGYMGGGVAIPYVPAKDTLWATEGDAAPLIQASIDRVSATPPDKNGFRGAVFLRMGYYELHAPLKIAASGVVLRGEGMGHTGTILIGIGEFKGNTRQSATLIQVEGASRWEPDEKTKQVILDEYVPVGSRSFRVANAKGFKPGDTVIVRRIGNQDWIHELGQDLENKEWRWEPFVIPYDRVITAVNDNTITVDAPITCAIETRWGGGEVVKYTDSGRIEKMGIENLRGMSDYNQKVRTSNYGNIDRQPYIGEEYYSDEDHFWTLISINNAKNVWVRNVTALHFGGSHTSVRPGAKWVTIQDCESWEPVSIRAGGRRFTYQISGQLSFVQRCISDKGRHSFVLGGYQACGPNVFLNGLATIPYNSSEPHSQWVTGVLYDNIKAPLTARYWKNISIGWAGANTVFWNCEGPFLIQKPPTANNYSFGHIGIHAMVFNTEFQDLKKPNGYIESWDKHVTPSSLYLTQLRERLGEQALKNIGYESVD